MTWIFLSNKRVFQEPANFIFQIPILIAAFKSSAYRNRTFAFVDGPVMFGAMIYSLALASYGISCFRVIDGWISNRWFRGFNYFVAAVGAGGIMYFAGGMMVYFE